MLTGKVQRSRLRLAEQGERHRDRTVIQDLLNTCRNLGSLLRENVIVVHVRNHRDVSQAEGSSLSGDLANIAMTEEQGWDAQFRVTTLVFSVARHLQEREVRNHLPCLLLALKINAEEERRIDMIEVDHPNKSGAVVVQSHLHGSQRSKSDA